MRASLLRSAILVGAVAASVTPESLACSGPGAARAMRRSELFGWSFAGISIAIVAGGCHLARRRSPDRSILWIVAPLALHPRWWMDAGHGDCGVGLCFWSLIFTLGIAVAVTLAVLWPRPSASGPKKGRWMLCGSLAGLLIGLLIAAVMLVQAGPRTGPEVALAAAIPCSTTIAGAMAGGGIFGLRHRSGRRFQFRMRTLLLLPIASAPLCVALLPVRPYQASVSMAAGFHFAVVDGSTGKPIPGAAVQVIDPRFALDDADNQGARAVTAADGRVEYNLYANIHGREGLLGRTETISYHPSRIRIEAPGYRPFSATLADEPATGADRTTVPTLGLTFPPPPSVTIRLSRMASDPVR